MGGGTRVYVGGLPYGVREKDLERFFRGYGRIRDVLIKNGYGFVDFDDHRDADDAVYELNGKDLLGERVVVERARGTPRDSRGRSSRRTPRLDSYRGPPTRTEYRLIVENLSSRVSWQDLKDFMRQAGEVTYADAHKQRRNEGVVEFASHSDLKAAIRKLDDTDLSGRRIKLVEDRGKKSRSRSSSRSRSRSRSRRRSKDKSRSKSASSRSRSKSRSKSRSRSRDPKSKSRSRTPEKVKKEKSKSKSRSRSPPSKRSRSGSRGRARSRSRSRSRTPSKSVSRSRSRDRSRTPDKAVRRSRSPGDNGYD